MLIGLSARAVAIPVFISSGALSARTTSRPDQPLGASFAGAPNVKAVTVKTVPIIRFWAQIPPLRRTYQEVPNLRALELTVWATDPRISLPVPKSAPASIIVPPSRSMQIRPIASMPPITGIAFVARLLGVEQLGRLFLLM